MNNKQSSAWEGSEEWEQLAYELCIDDGHDEESAHDLIWDGSPIPEPWGERWQKYEDEAKRMIAFVRKFAYTAKNREAEIEALKGDGKVCARCGAIAYDPVIKQTAKTLTDEEIDECHKVAWRIADDATGNNRSYSKEFQVIYQREFSRAIIRKAQEG